MDLYAHPFAFCPQSPVSLSRSARVWCLGGAVWMAAGLFFLLLSFVKTGIYPEWGVFCSAMNPGILRQVAVALLIYGWGMPTMWGIALLLLGRGSSFDPAWTRAGAWGWNCLVFGGAAAVLSGNGSGISAMPFPAAVWPALVLAVVPVFLLIARVPDNDSRMWGVKGKLSFMSALLGVFYLAGGTVSVFFVSLPAYFRTLAAECTTFGLASGILVAFALAIHLPERRERRRYEWGYVLSWLVFVLTQSFLFMGLRSGMVDKWVFILLALPGFWSALFLAGRRFGSLKGKWPGIYWLMAGCWILWGFWYFLYAPSAVSSEFAEVPGAWLVYLLILMMGPFACFSALFLYQKVPSCTGRDWLSRRGLVCPLLCWMGGMIFYYVGMFVAAGRSSEEPVFIYWREQSWVGTISVLMLLAGVMIFAIHLALVWSGGGRITAMSMIGWSREDVFCQEKDEMKNKGEDLK